ncbi:MAG: hypothetical protein KJ623_02705 [Nanoarchaeota archaeon]|nr:hypothetical protein [Nanoarchaeota archaeon]MBU0962523.1 hypothetical protein [Nanoarchaeota archaeon]
MSTDNILNFRKKLEENYSSEGNKVIFVPKPHISIEATTLDDLYFKAIDYALKYGRLYKIDSGSFAGEHRIEFDSASLIVTSPTARPLAPIPREGIPVITNDEKIEEYFCDYLMDGSLKPNEHYKYSSWIVGMPEGTKLDHNEIPRGTRFNQLEWCINYFINAGYGNNHCSITVGCAEGLKRYDWKSKSDAEKGSTECLRQVSLKIKDNKLNLTCFFRSWDLVAGMPGNLGGLTRLMEYTVDSINEKKKESAPLIKTGNLYAHSDGLHIYEHNVDFAKLWVGMTE